MTFVRNLLKEGLRQENRVIHAELQSFGNKTQEVMKRLWERMRELEAELDSDRSCRQQVQANALALQAELEGLRRQQAKQVSQGLMRAGKEVRAS